MKKISERLSKVELKSNAQIAVFASPQSVCYAPTVTTDFVRLPPETLSRVGAPYDIYMFSDLKNSNLQLDQYRLIIFLNAFKIGDNYSRQINGRLKKDGKTLLWIFAANYIRKDGNSLEAMSSMVDMEIRTQEETCMGKTAIKNKGLFSNLHEGITFGFSPMTKGDNRDLLNKRIPPQVKDAPMPSPTFYIDDKDATILGHYTDTRNPSLGYKKLEKHTTFWSAAPAIPAEVYREIARSAGVHIYYEGESPTFINNRLLGIHIQGEPNPNVKLPGNKTVELEDLFEKKDVKFIGGEGVLQGNDGEVKFYLLQGDEGGF